MSTDCEGRVNAAELARQFEAMAPEDKRQLFRPYVWRDPARLNEEQRAALAARDEAEGVCSCCGGPPWFCGVH